MNERASSQSAEDFYQDAIEGYAMSLLCCFEKDDCDGHPLSLLEDGVAAYLDVNPVEKELFKAWAERGGPRNVWERELWDIERFRAMAKFCREDMGYEWLTHRGRFAYDYSEF